MGKRKKSKKNKGKNMANWGGIGKKVGSYFGVKKTPSTRKGNSTLNVVLYSQKLLNQVRDIGLPAAGGSEYQVHYRGLQMIFKHPETGQRLVFTIPTVFFNFSQEVTTASVSFSLDEVSEISNQLIPVSDQLVAKFAEVFPKEEFIERGFELEARELEMGSIHRHPGDFGFSGVDRDNKAENPGVIFRNAVAEDKIQTDSVMYIPSANVPTKIVVTETQVVNVNLLEDGGIDGTYTEMPTITFIVQDNDIDENAPVIKMYDEFFKTPKTATVSDDSAEVENLFDFKILESKHCPVQDAEFVKEQLQRVLSSFLSTSKYEPVLIMDPNLIKSRVYNYGSHYTGTRRGTAYDYEDWDDDIYGDGFSVSSNSKKTFGASKQTRPVFKEQQAKRQLTIVGIDPKKFGVDGSATPEDTAAYVNALKSINYTDQQIRVVMRTLDYDVNQVNACLQVAKEPEKNEGVDLTSNQLPEVDGSLLEVYDATDIERKEAKKDSEFSGLGKVMGSLFGGI